MRLFTVLGIHHSGTTCLAGVLARSGVQFARELRKDTDEDDRILRFHARLLDWMRPTLVQDRGIDEARNLILTYRLEENTGFKEPSTLFTLPIWKQVVEEQGNELKLVGTFRHPALVMDHFRSQFGGSDEQWSRLWCTYMERMLEERDVSPFPLVCFDDGPEVYGHSIDKVLSALGLAPVRPPLFDLTKRRRSWPTSAAYSPNSRPSVPSKRAFELYAELRSRL